MTNKIKHITEQPGYEPRTDSIYVALPGERYTPFSLGKKLGAKAIFESASFSHGRSRYSTKQGLEIVKKIHERHPETPIYIMTYGSLAFTPGIENFVKM